MKDERVKEAAKPRLSARKGFRHRPGDLLLFCTKDRDDDPDGLWVLRGLKDPALFRETLPGGDGTVFDARAHYFAILCTEIRETPDGPKSVYVWYDSTGTAEPRPGDLRKQGFLPAVRTELDRRPPFRIRRLYWHYRFTLLGEGFYTGRGGSLEYCRLFRMPEEAERFRRLSAAAGAGTEAPDLGTLPEAFRAFFEERIRASVSGRPVCTLTAGKYGEPALVNPEEAEQARRQISAAAFSGYPLFGAEVSRR